MKGVFILGGKRYLPQEDQMLLAGWWNPFERERISKALGRSPRACSFRYYRLLKKKGITPTKYKHEMIKKEKPLFSVRAVEDPEKRIEMVYDTDLESLQKEIDALKETLQNRDKQFVSWLENIAHMFSANKSELNMQEILQENQDLKRRIEELEKESQSLKEKLIQEKEHYSKVYNELDFWLGQFLKLSSLEKVTSLQDFIPRLKTVVDKWGTIIAVEAKPKAIG